MTGRISLESRSRSGLQTLAGQLRFAEEVHFVGLLANVALAALFSLLRDVRFLVWLTVFNVMMNLYPNPPAAIQPESRQDDSQELEGRVNRPK